MLQNLNSVGFQRASRQEDFRYLAPGLEGLLLAVEILFGLILRDDVIEQRLDLALDLLTRRLRITAPATVFTVHHSLRWELREGRAMK